MTSRELAKLARHIIQTYPDYYKIYGEREFTWNKIRQFNRNPLLAHEHRRRRAEDRLHQGSRLRPGRLGGAERFAPDRGGQRLASRRRSEPTRARSCWNGDSTTSSPDCCSPKARRSRRPSSMAARKATCRWSARREVQADGAARHAREDHRPRGLFRSGARAGAGRARRSAR